jgi:hypothetical protein
VKDEVPRRIGGWFTAESIAKARHQFVCWSDEIGGYKYRKVQIRAVSDTEATDT